MRILELTSTSTMRGQESKMYINFDLVTCWEQQGDGGSYIVFVDDQSIMVKESAEQIYGMLNFPHAYPPGARNDPGWAGSPNGV